jgi:hypothetical protein
VRQRGRDCRAGAAERRNQRDVESDAAHESRSDGQALQAGAPACHERAAEELDGRHSERRHDEDAEHADRVTELFPEDHYAEDRRRREHDETEERRDEDRCAEDARGQPRGLFPSGPDEVRSLDEGERGRQVPERLGPGDGDAVHPELPRAGDRSQEPLVEAVVAEQHDPARVGPGSEGERPPSEGGIGSSEARKPALHVPGEDDGLERLAGEPPPDGGPDAEDPEGVEEPVADDVQRRGEQIGGVRDDEAVVGLDEEAEEDLEQDRGDEGERHPAESRVRLAGDGGDEGDEA